jgi:hypothetical protein
MSFPREVAEVAVDARPDVLPVTGDLPAVRAADPGDQREPQTSLGGVAALRRVEALARDAGLWSRRG